MKARCFVRRCAAERGERGLATALAFPFISLRERAVAWAGTLHQLSGLPVLSVSTACILCPKPGC